MKLLYCQLPRKKFEAKRYSILHIQRIQSSKTCIVSGVESKKGPLIPSIPKCKVLYIRHTMVLSIYISSRSCSWIMNRNCQNCSFVLPKTLWLESTVQCMYEMQRGKEPQRDYYSSLCWDIPMALSVTTEGRCTSVTGLFSNGPYSITLRQV